MTGDERIKVVVAAGGLGTRVCSWARYLPKEFWPVDGRPGIVHILEEIAQLGPAHVVIVHHPYYQAFADWARQALSPHGRARYLRAAARPLTGHDPAGDLTVDFVAQHGPYADLTSILNAADHFAAAPAMGPDQMYVAFSDNLYPGSSPLLALRASPAAPAVLARPYQAELAGRRGVIVTTAPDNRMLDLVEKPDPITARNLERHHGTDNLMLLEGRARLTREFIAFARTHTAPAGSEPKLALAIGAYSRTRQVLVIPADSEVIDLGSPPATSDTRRRTA